jgi:hypothetical protein
MTEEIPQHVILSPALFIYPDDELTPVVARAIPGGKVEYKDEMWEKMQAFIGVDFLEHVSVMYAGRVGHLMVDENGLAKNKPLNSFASMLYWNATIMRIMGGQSENKLKDLSPIVGRAILLPWDTMQ